MALTWLAEEPNEAGGGEGVVRHGALLRVRTYIFGVLTAVVEDCEDFDLVKTVSSLISAHGERAEALVSGVVVVVELELNRALLMPPAGGSLPS